MAGVHRIHHVVRCSRSHIIGRTEYCRFSTSIEQIAKLIELQSHNSQDALVAQAKAFIQTTITTYANNGFIVNFFKVS
jgi:hypothetical protein